MEGDEAVYQEFAYGQPGQQNQQGQEKADVNDNEEELLLTANGEYVETMTEKEVLEKLMPIFYNNEDDVKRLLSGLNVECEVDY